MTPQGWTLRPRVLTALLAGLLAVPATTPQSMPPASLEWWGDTEPGKGFHLRVPVTVENEHGFTVTDGAVLAQVDLGERLIRAGWVHDAKGAKDQLASFDLDAASVRVVEMTDLEPPTPGTVHGRLKAYDTARGQDDPRRYEVPSTHYEGFLQGGSVLEFNNRTNPVVTVLWRVEGPLAPGQARHFMVYFDSLTNQDGHARADYRSVRGAHRLETTFWSGPGVDLVGYAKPSGTAFVRVLGLHDSTTVSVYTEAPGGAFQLQIPKPGTHQNPFTLGADQWRSINLGKDPTNFRLVADRPILALVDSEGYVPARTGGFAGTEFLFASTYAPAPGADMQDSLFVHNLDPAQGDVTVQVQAIDGGGAPAGAPIEVHLSDAQNPFPYTRGTNALEVDPSTCTYPTGPTNPKFPPGQTYRASLVKGKGPVAIQFQPFMGVTQVPDLEGSALGTEFWSALSRSTASLQGSSCPTTTRQYQFFAASPSDTHLEISNPYEAEGRRLHPACGSPTCPPGQPLGPAASIDFKTIATGLNDRPMVFTTDEPSWLMVGPNAERSLASVALHGPLGGGDTGRSFAGFGAVRIYAPFEGTRVAAHIDYATRSGIEVPMNLIKGRSTALPERPGDAILRYTLESNRPIVVLPQGASSSFLAGVPTLLTAQLGDAEFRGYLVDVASVTGLNPVTESTVPGTPVTYRFRVANLARDARGAGLTDTIELCPAKVPQGWKAEVLGSDSCERPATIRLTGGESALVAMSVTPPQSVGPGDLGAIALNATSRSNPLVRDAVQTVTNIKRTFGVGLSFDAVRGADGILSGLREKEAAISAGQIARYDLYVQNLGSVQGTFTVDLTPPEGGWDVLVGGQESAQVTLEPLGKGKDFARIELQVLPPRSQAAAEGLLLTTVTAKSLDSPATLDRVTATTKLQAPSDLVLEANGTTQWVKPGENATFGLTLRNKGAGTTEVKLGLQADPLPGWKGPATFLRNLQTGRFIPLDVFSIGPGDAVPLAVVATAAPDAPAGQRTAIRLQASSPTQGAGLEAFLYAIVLPVHNVTTHLEGGPALHVQQGGTKVHAKVRLSNGGNLDENLQPAIASLPAGWVVDLPATKVLVPRNQTQVLEMAISVPNGTAVGEHLVEVHLVAQDGNHTGFLLPVRVGTFAQYGLTAPETILGQPHRPASIHLGLTNQGNTPLTFTARPSADEPWSLDGPQTLEVLPGEAVTWTLTWLVPPDAPEGTSTHSLDLSGRSGDPQAQATQRTVEMAVAVGRAELRVGSATAFQGAAGQIVRAVVANDGERPAFGVAVDLRVGSEAIDRVTIAKMDPGSVHNVTFLWPDGADAGAASVFVDSAGAVVEADETDNVVALSPAKQDERGISFAPVGTLLGVVALVALWLRRKTS